MATRELAKRISAAGAGDEIRQWEIAALLSLEAAENALALNLKRRIEAGATVQAGPYFLIPDHETMADLKDQLEDAAPSSISTYGFSEIGWKEPARAKRRRAGVKRPRRGRE